MYRGTAARCEWLLRIEANLADSHEPVDNTRASASRRCRHRPARDRRQPGCDVFVRIHQAGRGQADTSSRALQRTARTWCMDYIRGLSDELTMRRTTPSLASVSAAYWPVGNFAPTVRAPAASSPSNGREADPAVGDSLAFASDRKLEAPMNTAREVAAQSRRTLRRPERRYQSRRQWVTAMPVAPRSPPRSARAFAMPSFVISAEISLRHARSALSDSARFGNSAAPRYVDGSLLCDSRSVVAIGGGASRRWNTASDRPLRTLGHDSLRKRPPLSIETTALSFMRRADYLCARWNCSASVEPASAAVADWPLVTAIST